jgi:hypothetical protein
MRIEGVVYQINWKAFKRGASFFIPCLNPEAAKEDITFVTDRLQYEVVTKTVIEHSIQGVRVWRV